jgi:hypothetical protein
MRSLLAVVALSQVLLCGFSSAAQAGAPNAHQGSESAVEGSRQSPGNPPSLGDVVDQLSEAVSGKQWSLALSLLVVALVLVLRKAASAAGSAGSGALSRALLWLTTARGAVALSVVGGTATLLSVALGGGKPLSFSLLVSCFMGAASASGLFSWGQTLTRPKPAAGPVCSPDEIANGTCKV